MNDIPDFNDLLQPEIDDIDLSSIDLSDMDSISIDKILFQIVCLVEGK